MEETAEHFNITTSESGETLVIRTDGYLDDKGGQALSRFVNGTFDKNYKNYVLNFEKSPVINSQGISQILEICEIVLDEREGNLCFVGLNELTRGVFKMVGLLEMADFFDSENEAVNNFA